MTNTYYTKGDGITRQTLARAESVNNELQGIQDGFDAVEAAMDAGTERDDELEQQIATIELGTSIGPASQAEAEAGVNNGKWMSALRTKQAFDEFLADEIAHGYQEFLASSTWSKPASAKWVFVEVIGGGGGGASGRRGAGATDLGGSGGGGAPVVTRFLNAADLAATETITVGAAGAGGPSRIINDQGGGNGTAGGNSSFGTWVIGHGGRNGVGGLDAFSNAGAPGRGFGDAVGTTAPAIGFEGPTGTDYLQDRATIYGGAGGGGAVAGAGPGGAGNSSLFSAGGGGAGGSVYSTTSLSQPNAGGKSGVYVAGGGGAAGVSHATVATAGTAGSGQLIGGGGGGSSNGGAGAIGGAGGIGAGGGGGGASGNGYASGAGGAGGAGRVRIWWG